MLCLDKCIKTDSKVGNAYEDKGLIMNILACILIY